MSDDNLKKTYSPRRNPQHTRPPPGVQKAMQTFGVRDLREILDKKRQEQGESQGDKRPDSKAIKLPPPDPSYNYLKDPTRDRPRLPQKKADQERPIARDRETNSRLPRSHEDKDIRDQKSASQGTKQQEIKENNCEVQEKGVLKKNQNFPQSDGAHKKELRFSDTTNVEGKPQFRQCGNHSFTGRERHFSDTTIVEGQPQFRHGGRHSFRGRELRFSNTTIVDEQSQFGQGGRDSFRGRNPKRGSGMSKEGKEEKIANPVNIKIELSTETGQRNCTLDKNTKIPDIKHVPDQIPYSKYVRGGFRGGKGSFRGRGRGRGSFRGRGAASSKRNGAELEEGTTNRANTFNMDNLKSSLPDNLKKDANAASVENGNKQSTNATSEKTNLENMVSNHGDPEENLEHYDEYEQDNEEDYNDANENYDDEYSNQFYSEYQNDSSEYTQDLDSSGGSYEHSTNIEQYEQAAPDEIDPSLRATITITSSTFQDGGVKRSFEVLPDEHADGKESVMENEEGK